MEPMCKSVFFDIVMHRRNKLTPSAAVLPMIAEHHFLHCLNIFYSDSGAIVPTPHAQCLAHVRAIPRLQLLLTLPTNPDASRGYFDGGAISGTIRWHGISKTSQDILFAHACRLYRSHSHVTIYSRRAEPVCMRLLSSNTPYILADGLD